MSILKPCRLCLEPRVLRASHFVPASFYPKNKRLEMATRESAQVDSIEVVDRVLCENCERRFNRFGENDALRWLAPKAKSGSSPLWKAIRAASPAFSDADCAMYFASALGLPVGAFAYLVLSLVWRSAAHSWTLPDGKRTVPLDLGDYYEPLREYLSGQRGFPEHTYLTMALCTDRYTQRYWLPPSRSEDLPGLIVVPLFGALFRVWFGRVIPRPIESQVFFPSDANRVFVTHCWDVLGPSLSELFDGEDAPT
jgi:hypothetical protein